MTTINLWTQLHTPTISDPSTTHSAGHRIRRLLVVLVGLLGLFRNNGSTPSELAMQNLSPTERPSF